MFDDLRKRGVTAGPNQPIYTTIGLGMRHTGLGRASLPQKLARARLLARGLGPLVRTTACITFSLLFHLQVPHQPLLGRLADWYDL
jgi:hypothetical protein